MNNLRKISFWEHKLSLLDIIILKLRENKIKTIVKLEWKIVADTWSWYNAYFLQSIKNKIKLWYAIDLNINNNLKINNIKTIKSNLNNKINLKNNSIDIVISMAILEHLENPKQYLKEIKRILTKEWELIMTIPSLKSKPILEFLAYKLHLISKQEIKDHKKYYNKKSLLKILINSWFEKKYIKHKYFQFWMNNLITYNKI